MFLWKSYNIRCFDFFNDWEKKSQIKICISFDGDHKSSDERDVGKTTRTTSSKLQADEAVANIDTKDSLETSHNGIETKGEGQDIPITDPTCPVCFRYSISKKS